MPRALSSRSLFSRCEWLGPLLALALLIAGTALVEALRVPPESRAFLSVRNFANVLGQWSFVGIVALGMTFVIIMAGIDLSVGSMVALAAGAAVMAMNAAAERWGEGAGIAAACAACLVGGPVLGLFNGLVVARGRIAPFIATLGTLAIYRSLITAPAQGSEIRSMVPAFSRVAGGGLRLPAWMGGTPARVSGDGTLLPAVEVLIRTPALVFFGCALLSHFVLSRTVFGRRVYAIGDNTQAARYAGVGVGRVTAIVYGISGLACGVAALLNASRLNSVSSSSLGLYYELDAIAAVVIGGTRLQGGAGRIFGTVIGVLIMGVVGNMLNMLGVSNFYHGLVKGLIIIAAVLVQPRKSGA